MSTPIQRPTPVQPDRTPDGLPKDLQHQTEYPGNWAQINGAAQNGQTPAPLTAHIDQRRIWNDGLPWLIGAWVTAAVSLALLLALIAVLALMLPSWIEAKIEAGTADARALAELARKEASTAKDMVDLERAQRKAKEGIRQ